jgi:Putative beta-barrel porin 2
LVARAQAQTVPTVQAGGDPSKARFQAGPVAISPVIAVTNLGVDNNVFNTSSPVEPTSDLTATIGPALDAWVRLPRVRFSGRGVFNYAYFRELTDLSSFQLQAGGRVEVPLNRVTLWADGSLVNSNARQGYEIDAYAAHKENSGRIGADVRLTPKTGVGVYAGQTIIDYGTDTVETGIIAQARLALALNRTGTYQGVGVRYALTPLTTFTLFGEQQQDRFEFARDKNADSFRIMPSLEFKPFALISGHASFGYRNINFTQSTAPDFSGPVGQLDLQYTLLGRTELSVTARRDVEFSFYSNQNYLIGTIGGGIAHRLSGGLDVRGSVAVYRLEYRNRFPGQGSEPPQEKGISARGEVGYQLRRSRVSFYIDGSHRNSEVTSVRGYDRLRFGSNILYTF